MRIRYKVAAKAVDSGKCLGQKEGDEAVLALWMNSIFVATLLMSPSTNCRGAPLVDVPPCRLDLLGISPFFRMPEG